MQLIGGVRYGAVAPVVLATDNAIVPDYQNLVFAAERHAKGAQSASNQMPKRDMSVRAPRTRCLPRPNQ